MGERSYNVRLSFPNEILSFGILLLLISILRMWLASASVCLLLVLGVLATTIRKQTRAEQNLYKTKSEKTKSIWRIFCNHVCMYVYAYWPSPFRPSDKLAQGNRNRASPLFSYRLGIPFLCEVLATGGTKQQKHDIFVV